MQNDLADLKLLQKELDEATEKQKQKLPAFKFNKDGTAILSNSIYNAKLIIENDPLLSDAFKYNVFTDEIDIVKNIDSLGIKAGLFKDEYITYIAYYIESQPAYMRVLFTDKIIMDAIVTVAQANHYNPILDYFNNVYDKWDKNKRIETVFQSYLGADDSEEVRLIARTFFTGAVAKAYDPEVKFDYVLDLVGGQGAGKTTFLKKIAPLNYYTDQFTKFDDKDSYSVMKRALIINDDEMTATNAASFEVLKKFVTLQQFEYREAYGRKAKRFSKNFVMARTTNEMEYLRDKTGERRFLPVLADRKKQALHPVSDLDNNYIDQLWGEAVYLYKSGTPLFFSQKEEEAVDKYRQAFMKTDAIEDKLDEIISLHYRDAKHISPSELAHYLTGDKDAFIKNKKLSNQINNIMINKYRMKRKNQRVNGIQRKVFMLDE